MNVETIGGWMRACCGVGAINICIDNGNSAEINVVVVCDKPVGFDLLAGIDAITALGGINITPSEAIQFCSKETPICSMIYIDQSDLFAEFNHWQMI